MWGASESELGGDTLERFALPVNGKKFTGAVDSHGRPLHLASVCEQYVAGLKALLLNARPSLSALFFARSEHQRRTEHVGELGALSLAANQRPKFNTPQAAEPVDSECFRCSLRGERETRDEALRRLRLRSYAPPVVGERDQLNRIGNPRIIDGPVPRVFLVGLDDGAAQQVLSGDRYLEVRVAPSFARGRDELPRMQPDVIVVAIDDPAPAAIAELPTLLSAYRAPMLIVSGPVDEQRVTAVLKAGAGGYLLREELFRLPDAVRELLRGGVPMSPLVSQLVLGRARRSSAKMAAVRPGSPMVDELITNRQREILELLAHGHSYEDIGLALSLSINTVRSHVRAIYERLGASTKVEAVITAIELKLLDRASLR
jgi:DNA-binding NarL/FixJ family response regulator